LKKKSTRKQELCDCPSNDLIEAFREQIDEIIEKGLDDGLLFYMVLTGPSNDRTLVIDSITLSELHKLKYKIAEKRHKGTKFPVLERLR
jgi:hypothetical protein